MTNVATDAPSETEKVWTVDEDLDIRVASWRVATLLFGADDGTEQRDRVEIAIAEVISRSFEETEGLGWPPQGFVHPENTRRLQELHEMVSSLTT